MSELNEEYDGTVSKGDVRAAAITGVLAGGGLYGIALVTKTLDLKLAGESITSDIARLRSDSLLVTHKPEFEASEIINKNQLLGKTNFKTEIQEREKDLKALQEKSIVGELGLFIPAVAVIFGLKAATICHLFRDNHKRSKAQTNSRNNQTLDM